MKAVVQRVKKAKVAIDGVTSSEIGNGILVLVAIAQNDDISVIKWMSNKLVNLRIFPDNELKMNRSVLDIKGEILMISNFTVYGDVRKGFRPNFMKSAGADLSEPLYSQMISYMRKTYPLNVADGKFGAMMDIELINAGPVTVIIEKEND